MFWIKRPFSWIFSFFVLSFIPNKVWSAACCGGGFAAPSLISSDDKAQLTSSLSYVDVVVANVDSQGIWRRWESQQRVQTFRLEGAHVFWDRFQAGFSLPVIERRQQTDRYAGLGDVSTSVGYEYLPDWDYNPYRPKGIGFLQLTFPTGKSRADSEVGGLDSRGNGFWALGVGTLLTKTWSRWDAFLNFEAHRSFSKEVSNSQVDGTLEPGFGGNLGWGAGYNLQNYRIGSSLTWTYEDAVAIRSRTGLNSDGAIERFATAVLSFTYMASDEWASTLNYTDQTLFGSPVNTSLGRGLAFQLQRRWGR